MSKIIDISPEGCMAVSVQTEITDAVTRLGGTYETTEIVTVCGDRTFSIRNEVLTDKVAETFVTNAAQLCIAMCIDCPRKSVTGL